MMIPRTVLSAFVALGLTGWLLAVSGCAHSGTGQGGNYDVLTAEEIQSSSASDVYHLIRRSRPRWLQVRGALTASTVETDDGATLDDPEIIVYMDGNRLESVADLESISIEGISSIRRLNAREATQRYGTGHSRGAIIVSRTP